MEQFPGRPGFIPRISGEGDGCGLPGQAQIQDFAEPPFLGLRGPSGGARGGFPKAGYQQAQHAQPSQSLDRPPGKGLPISVSPAGAPRPGDQES
jgi:hypothetical protein